MSPEEYAAWRKKEAEIGACWTIAVIGLGILTVIQGQRDPGLDSIWTWVIAGTAVTVLLASIADDIWGRGKKNRSIRAAHTHLRK